MGSVSRAAAPRLELDMVSGDVSKGNGRAAVLTVHGLIAEKQAFVVIIQESVDQIGTWTTET